MTRNRKNGFILILVVALIPLIGVISAVLTVNSRNLLVRVRLEGLQQQARGAVDSGLAWAAVHPRQVAALETARPIILTLETHPEATCEIALISSDRAQTVVQVTGHVTDSRFSATHRQTLTPPAP